MTLHRKFLISMAFQLLVLMLAFVALQRFNLQSGLGSYLAEIELNRFDTLVTRLQQTYQQQGWQTLQNNANAWGRLQIAAAEDNRPQLHSDIPPPVPEPTSAPDHHQPPPEPLASGVPPDRTVPPEAEQRGTDILQNNYMPPPPPDADPHMRAESVYQRLALFAGDQYVVGAHIDASNMIRRPVLVNGKVVGWLCLAPLNNLSSQADRTFLARESSFLLATGAVGLLLTLLISWYLARRWLGPILSLQRAASDVSDGHFDVQVPVIGQDELTELSRAFNSMTLRLTNIESSRQRWLSDIAHELRTPLAAMRAEVESLQDGVRRYDDSTAPRLHRQIMRLINLVEDLRDSMTMESADARLNIRLTAPISLLLEVVDELRERFVQAGIRLDTDEITRPNLTPMVRADARALTQVFTNLLENSLRYTTAPGSLLIDVQILQTHAAPLLMFSFDDTPPCPAPTDMPHLFERLYRADLSRSRLHGGSGLGLSICRDLILAHGGRIHAAPSALGGLRIEVCLPLDSNVIQGKT